MKIAGICSADTNTFNRKTADASKRESGKLLELPEIRCHNRV
jgi:hypothetical protein